ncbi:MAG: hypothetical protein SFV17_05295 [Candidatus Obscuribacter sp.]|nr:hypothetical protein [Candidatus Obscuribacter sp.]
MSLIFVLLADPSPLTSALPTHSAALLSPLPELLAIFIAEILFSWDNIMAVEHFAAALPAKERHRALKWGLTGALLIRGLSLVLMTFAKSFDLVMLVASVHMVSQTAIWFFGFHMEESQQPPTEPVRRGTHFLRAIILIEVADFFFSIDNVAIAVSISKNLWLSFTGVAMGLIFVRFFWRRLKFLLMRHPRLADTSRIVTGLLGLQLLLKLTLKLQISPWLDLLTVMTAIAASQLFDGRKIGTKLRIKASLLTLMVILCLTLWIEAWLRF